MRNVFRHGWGPRTWAHWQSSAKTPSTLNIRSAVITLNSPEVRPRRFSYHTNIGSTIDIYLLKLWEQIIYCLEKTQIIEISNHKPPTKLTCLHVCVQGASEVGPYSGCGVVWSGRVGWILGRSRRDLGAIVDAPLFSLVVFVVLLILVFPRPLLTCLNSSY